MVWPSPHGIFANKSVLGFSTTLIMASCSARNCSMLLLQAAALGGASVFGQYPSGHFGDTCFLLRLNSRMSHCAMRMCSRIIHEECGKLAGLAPRRFGGRPLTTSSNLA